jgi:hypothetical protein
MNKIVIIYVTLGLLIVSIGTANAEKGLTIRGGLLHDTPKYEVFDDMEAGVGYIGSIGYDLFEKFGADLGVMHSTHEYRVGLRGSAVIVDKADKTAIFFRLRYLPLKSSQYEIEVGAGPAYYSTSADIEIEELALPVEEGFDGWGYTLGVDLKHFATDNLAITLYLSANIVKYSKQTVNTIELLSPSRLPRGDSFSWGLTIFYRIGKINLN